MNEMNPMDRWIILSAWNPKEVRVCWTFKSSVFSFTFFLLDWIQIWDSASRSISRLTRSSRLPVTQIIRGGKGHKAQSGSTLFYVFRAALCRRPAPTKLPLGTTSAPAETTRVANLHSSLATYDAVTTAWPNALLDTLYSHTLNRNLFYT